MGWPTHNLLRLGLFHFIPFKWTLSWILILKIKYPHYWLHSYKPGWTWGTSALYLWLCTGASSCRRGACAVNRVLGESWIWPAITYLSVLKPFKMQLIQLRLLRMACRVVSVKETALRRVAGQLALPSPAWVLLPLPASSARAHSTASRTCESRVTFCQLEQWEL